jgi:hypothetical protein
MEYPKNLEETIPENNHHSRKSGNLRFITGTPAFAGMDSRKRIPASVRMDAGKKISAFAGVMIAKSRQMLFLFLYEF